jgi:coproporphyrinogen III oxidase-like Fe-S oxidoreductase
MGAMSFVDDHTYFNERNTTSYIKKITEGVYDTGSGQRLSRTEAMQFSLLYGLRLRDYPTTLFETRYGVGMQEEFKDKIETLKVRNFIELSNEQVRLTRDGILSLTEIEQFISSDVRVLEIEAQP